MSWKLAIKRKRPPPGWDLVEPRLDEFEERMREAMNEPVDSKMKNEMTWIVHKIHYQKNRLMYDLYHVEHKISKRLYDYLIEMKIADGPLIAKWKKPGYDTLCSLAVIAKSNTNYRTTGICRVPLRQRHGQITPNVTTGCVSCASGDSGPIWWDDPPPDVVLKRRREVLVEEVGFEDRLKALKAEHNTSEANKDPASTDGGHNESHEEKDDQKEENDEKNDQKEENDEKEGSHGKEENDQQAVEGTTGAAAQEAS